MEQGTHGSVRMLAPFAAVLFVLLATFVIKVLLSIVSFAIGRRLTINGKMVAGGLGGLGCLVAAIVNFVNGFQNDLLGGSLIGIIYLGLAYYGYRMILSQIK